MEVGPWAFRLLAGPGGPWDPGGGGFRAARRSSPGFRVMFLAPGASGPGCASWLFAGRAGLPDGLDRLFLPNYNFCTLSTNTAPFLLLSIDRADLAWKSSQHKKIMPAGLIFRWLADAPLKKSYARESRQFGSLAADFEFALILSTMLQ